MMMTDEIAALGDIATGSAIARSFEPTAGEGSKTAVAQCANCGGALLGKHCHQCGQVGQVHRSLAAFWHDFLHSILHLDGKIWRTLPLLFLKPGDLTRRYVHGERARFVSPLALFLFSVFLMFAVFGALGGPFSPDVNLNNKGEASKDQLVLKKLLDARSSLKALEAKQAASPSQQTADEIAAIKGRLVGMETGATVSAALRADDRASIFNLAKADIDTGSAVWDARIRHSFQNPNLLLYKLQSNAYKFSWLLIILSTPFVWLLFAFRRQHRLYDHAIFVTYSISFMSFLLVIMALLRGIGVSPGYLLLAVPAHMFAQLKGAYELRTRSALWRTFGLLSIAVIVLLAFMALLLASGIEH